MTHLPVHNYERLGGLKDAPLVLVGNSLQPRRGDMSFPFVQEANFLYITGISEPDWAAIYTPARRYLVMPERTEIERIFDGGLSAAEAIKISGCDEVLSAKEGAKLLKELGIELPHSSEVVEEYRVAFARARAIKQPHEIEALREAIRVTNEAFEDVKRRLPEFSHEYEIEAEFNRAFRATGLQGHAYDPIVASGKNACTLHYCQNNDALPKNGTVLIDVGAQASYFNADITRTYAIGSPSTREREIHKAVEKAQKDIIALIRPGVKLREYGEQADEIMKQALRSVNLYDKADDFRKYFPHAVSHGLGIDVHESLGGYTEFAPGMVLTVEPGIYVPEEGIGVRIEDDVLVTTDGNEVLSASLATAL
ncbi:M24 family metallopeptidase [Candidatus Saccharibacteria bacterium]|nr:M24 family metallopeptidase [Candidatus Saccharibacteria bacterium]NCS82918.1 M24 family metallopeptidase [Candidatus Saccharibacteria bacterium]